MDASDSRTGTIETPGRAPLAAATALLLAAGPASAATVAGGGTGPGDLPVASGVPAGASAGPACLAARVSRSPTRVPMRATRRARGASGTMVLRFASSPYGVAVSPDGSYVQSLELTVKGVRARPGHTLVAWVATPDLERHERLGTVRAGEPLRAEVRWNKFLVFVTEEASADAGSWSQRILLTARSPSSYMHSMAGHGPFSSEPCLDPTL